MERAHRRHQPDACAPRAARGRSVGPQLGHGPHELHAGTLAAGERRASRSGASRRAGAGRARPPRRPRAGPARCCSSPRATGPVSARSGPSGDPVLDGSRARAGRAERAPRRARGRPRRPRARRPPRARAGSSRPSRRRRGRPRGPRRRSRRAPCRARSASSRASARAAGEEPATAQPAPASSTEAGGGAKVWSGCSPKASAPRSGGRLQGRERRGAAHVAHEGRRAGHGLRRRADLGVGHAEQDRAAAVRAPRRGPAGPSTGEPGGAQRGSQGGSQAAGTHDAHGGVHRCVRAGLHWLAGPLLAEVAADYSRIPSTASYVAPRLRPHAEPFRRGAPRGPGGALQGGRRLRALPAGRHPDPGRVRGRQRRRRPHVRRRGARASRRISRACRSWGGRASCSTSCWRASGLVPRRGVHHERPEVAAARQPRPPARRDRGLPALPRPPDRADRATA